ncbi:MAG: DUF84 family protein [Patescibacteria group bacterium]|nr:DUF84 family protein [Patescibacteria group bacterium]
MTIAICGSISFYPEIVKVQQRLEAQEIQTYIPKGYGGNDKAIKESLTYEEDAKRKIEYNLIKDYYQKILVSDAILVINLEKNCIKNYIGGNVFLEIGFAYVNNRPVFLYNPIPEDLSYKTEIMAMKPIIIHGNVQKIFQYFKSLPSVYVASNSRPKITAVSSGLKSVGFKANVVGRKVNSQIADQPIGFDQILLGAENRLNGLKKSEKDYDLLVAIESGLVNIGKYYIDLGACMIENKKGERQVSISNGSNVPEEIARYVTQNEKELGIYLQQKFGLEEKDVVSFLTKGQRSRVDHLAEAVATAYLQLNS